MTRQNKENSFLSFAKKMWTNDYIRNIIYALIIFFAIIYASKIFLNIFTHHNKTSPVPNFKGMIVNDAVELAKEKNLRIEIADSLFFPNEAPGIVLEQKPKAESQVKENRMIYLTINCILPKKIEAPNVVGYSFRQAKSVLASKGIKVGKLIYEPDMAMNNVIGQRCRDVETKRIVTENDPKPAKIFVGDEIELILGLGPNHEEQYTYAPNVVGQTIDEAKNKIIESYLNVGEIKYDTSIKTADEKRMAIVKSQSPTESNQKMFLGSSINLVLTKNKIKK